MTLVNKPEFAGMWTHAIRYWGYHLLVTNLNKTSDGGKAMVYSKDKNELYEAILKYDAEPEIYGKCMIRYVGPNNSMGGVFL